VETNTVTISGAEIFTAPLVLQFPKNACAQ
jgi:hypothetical protein